MSDSTPTDTAQPADAPDNDSQAAAPALDPSATGTSDNQPNPTDDIRNPEAYYKAQAEKNERLVKKYGETVASLEAQVSKLQEDRQQEVLDAIAKLRKEFDDEQAAFKAELDKAKSEAEAEKVTAMRVKALAAANLSADLLPLITGDSEEAIKESIDLITKHMGQRGQLASIRAINPQPDGKSEGRNPSWRRSDTFGRGGVTITE